ncbi:MAG: DMT family transporter [Planctomycetota bacterium]
MSPHHFGMLAALSAALCWSFGTFVFEAAGRRVGAFQLNLLRLTVALVLLSLTHLLVRGSIIPADVEARRLGLFALSGLVGLAIGDLCYFRSLLALGPGLAVLIQGLAPAFSAGLAWLALGEGLGLQDLAGITLTMLGVSWVAVEPHRSTVATAQTRRRWLGVLQGVAAAFCQGLGLVLAKEGLNDPGGIPVVSPLTATLARMTMGTLCAWVMAIATRQIRATPKSIADRRGMGFVALGAILGPFVGVWLSQIAIQNTPAGVAATLFATCPIMVLVLLLILRSERPSLRSALGATVAVAGVALLT